MDRNYRNGHRNAEFLPWFVARRYFTIPWVCGFLAKISTNVFPPRFCAVCGFKHERLDAVLPTTSHGNNMSRWQLPPLIIALLYYKSSSYVLLYQQHVTQYTIMTDSYYLISNQNTPCIIHQPTWYRNNSQCTIVFGHWADVCACYMSKTKVGPRSWVSTRFP